MMLQVEKTVHSNDLLGLFTDSKKINKSAKLNRGLKTSVARTLNPRQFLH